jgi:hypothetical protein
LVDPRPFVSDIVRHDAKAKLELSPSLAARDEHGRLAFGDLREERD